MESIKNARHMSEVIIAASKQCMKEKCRIGVAFANKESVERLVSSGLVSDLTCVSFTRGMLRTRFKNQSIINFFDMSIERMLGQRYDYILMDSQLSDDAKIVLRTTTFKPAGFKLGKNTPLIETSKDERKNIVQEFILADKWPLLKNNNRKLTRRVME